MVKKGRKRGNGEGSIDHMKDGRWRSRISIPGGKQRAFFGATRLEAAEKLATALAERNRPVPAPAPAPVLSVEEWGLVWLANIEKSLKPRVYARYRQLLVNQTLPSLGTLPLSSVTPQALRDLYAALGTGGLSAQTIVHLHALLHQIMQAACDDGLLARNPVKLVRPPRVRHHELLTLSASQAQQLIAAARSCRLGALYVVALTTGMRQGELLALRWSDIDLDKGLIQIRGSLQRSKQAGLVVEEPKTRSARRQVQLTQVALSSLIAHKAQSASPLVFSTQAGTYIEATNMIQRSFRPLLASCGLPPIRFHDLRHTAATLMLAGGIHPKIVSEMLGHAKISITLDLYSHALPTIQAEAVKVLDGMLAPG